MVKRHHVRHSEDQRTELEWLISCGKTSGRAITRARILMKAAGGWRDEEVVEAIGSSVATVPIPSRNSTGTIRGVHRCQLIQVIGQCILTVNEH